LTTPPSRCVLPDGRRLAYAVYGARDGRPVFYCHGFPGSRLEARLAEEVAAALGIALIAPDRPGFGQSDPLAGRALLDWPADLAALADHLAIERFHLVGVSGGGPYALAAAARLPQRLAGVGLVCALGRLGEAADTEGMAPMAARAVRLYQHLPGFADWLYAQVAGPLLGAHPDWIFRVIAGSAPPADREVLAHAVVRERLLDSFREAFHQGGEGPAHDLALYTGAWGFAPAEIRLPVAIWHGEADTTVPVAMARRHAALIPAAQAHFLPGEGHFSLVVRHMHDILSVLLAP
jgi:pimeloyl-ACP methyl ester carboxylesterase